MPAQAHVGFTVASDDLGGLDCVMPEMALNQGAAEVGWRLPLCNTDHRAACTPRCTQVSQGGNNSTHARTLTTIAQAKKVKGPKGPFVED